MLVFHDIYDRSLEPGDYVLCDRNYLNSVNQKNTIMRYVTYFKYSPDGLLRDAKGEIPDNALIKKNISNDEIITIPVYKIENIDEYLLDLFKNKKYSISESENNSHIKNLNSDNSINIRDIFGRKLGENDFVIYNLYNNRVGYGLIYGKNKVITKDGSKLLVSFVYKVENMTDKECVIYNNLKYVLECENKIDSLLYDFKELEPGDFYLNKSKDKMYLYLGDSWVNVLNIKTNKLLKSKINHPILIEFNLVKKKSKELLNKILQDKIITSNDLSFISYGYRGLYHVNTLQEEISNNFSYYCLPKDIKDAETYDYNDIFSYHLSRIEFNKINLFEKFGYSVYIIFERGI